MERVKNYLAAIIALVLAGVCVLVGILAFTVWRPAQQVHASVVPSQPIVMTRDGVINLIDAEVTVTATTTDGSPVQLALGATTDVVGWIGSDPYTEVIGVAADRQNLKFEDHPGDASQSGGAGGADGAQSGGPVLASDLWADHASGDGKAELTIADPQQGRSIIAVSDGQSANINLTIAWNSNQPNLLAIIAFVLGALLAIVGIVLIVLKNRQLNDSRRADQAQRLQARKSADVTETAHIDPTEVAAMGAGAAGAVGAGALGGALAGGLDSSDEPEVSEAPVPVRNSALHHTGLPHLSSDSLYTIEEDTVEDESPVDDFGSASDSVDGLDDPTGYGQAPAPVESSFIAEPGDWPTRIAPSRQRAWDDPLVSAGLDEEPAEQALGASFEDDSFEDDGDATAVWSPDFAASVNSAVGDGENDVLEEEDPALVEEDTFESFADEDDNSAFDETDNVETEADSSYGHFEASAFAPAATDEAEEEDLIDEDEAADEDDLSLGSAQRSGLTVPPIAGPSSWTITPQPDAEGAPVAEDAWNADDLEDEEPAEITSETFGIGTARLGRHAAESSSDQDPPERVPTDTGVIDLSAIRPGAALPTRRALREARERGEGRFVIDGHEFNTGLIPVIPPPATTEARTRSEASDKGSWGSILSLWKRKDEGDHR